MSEVPEEIDPSKEKEGGEVAPPVKRDDDKGKKDGKGDRPKRAAAYNARRHTSRRHDDSDDESLESSYDDDEDDEEFENLPQIEREQKIQEARERRRRERETERMRREQSDKRSSKNQALDALTQRREKRKAKEKRDDKSGASGDEGDENYLDYNPALANKEHRKEKEKKDEVAVRQEPSKRREEPANTQSIDWRVSLEKIRISRKDLDAFFPNNPFFENAIKKAFVRLSNVYKSSEDPSEYLVGEILDFKDSSPYKIETRQVKKKMVVRSGKKIFAIEMRFVSNGNFEQGEVSRWVVNMENNKLRVPTAEFLQTKETEIKGAKHHKLTEEERQKHLDQNMKSGNAPERIPIKIDYYQRQLDKVEGELFLKPANKAELEKERDRIQQELEKLREKLREYKEQKERKKLQERKAKMVNIPKVVPIRPSLHTPARVDDLLEGHPDKKRRLDDSEFQKFRPTYDSTKYASIADFKNHCITTFIQMHQNVPDCYERISKKWVPAS